MANPEHVEMLTTYTREQWDAWRTANPHAMVDISGQPIGIMRKNRGRTTDDGLADFRGIDFSRVDLTGSSFHESDLSEAMLVNRKFKKVLFPGTKMCNSKMMRSELRDCVFTFADLTQADLSNSKFPGSNFMNARLSATTLFQTDFRDADLTGADFSECDLRLVSFVGASLACSRLHLASSIVNDMKSDQILAVVRDEFDGSWAHFQEWRKETERSMRERSDMIHKSILSEEALDDDVRRFVRNEPWPRQKIRWDLGTVESIQELLTVLDRIMSGIDRLFGADAVQYYYRGEECDDWDLTPSLFREIKEGSESELVREMMTRVPDRFRGIESPFDRLVVAQQHGLPTRLLDVTRNPLVALYFALRKPISRPGTRCDGPARIHLFVTPPEMVRRHDDDGVNIAAAFSDLNWIEQDVLLSRCFKWRDKTWEPQVKPHDDHAMPKYGDVVHRLAELLSPTKSHLSDRIDPKELFRVFVVEPKQSFPRIRAQAGAFLLSAFHRRFEPDCVRGVDNDVSIYIHCTIDVDVSRKLRDKMLKQLDYLNINEETMFPGLESSAREIAAQHAKPADPGS